MLVSATEMLKKAKAGHYAVGQFNTNNLEFTTAWESLYRLLCIWITAATTDA